ncbi:AP-1 complex subunit sigma 1/2 [Clonorchis sinensis]|uniref:AP-1 complex subunit sigma 1/2 n=1 Tax=Clonorchis sinensis TaxID=79923 RepID=G7YNL5_CLOSI|nr:AP-1 complex subunit sigma 1/2 [Clonorchis sinensis]
MLSQHSTTALCSQPPVSGDNRPKTTWHSTLTDDVPCNLCLSRLTLLIAGVREIDYHITATAAVTTLVHSAKNFSGQPALNKRPKKQLQRPDVSGAEILINESSIFLVDVKRWKAVGTTLHLAEESLADMEHADVILIFKEEEKVQLFLSGLTKVIPSFGERQPLKDKNKTDPGNLGESLDPGYQSPFTRSQNYKVFELVTFTGVSLIHLHLYASLYFCTAIEPQDNELLTLEIIHRYVELLDKYFGSVCELDIIFHFEKAYYVLDEFLLGGEVQETGKDSALNDIDMQDLLQEEECKTREEQADISIIDVSEF